MKTTDPEKRTAPVTSGPSGLTLVEVVIGVGILLISMGALLWAFIGAKQSSTMARNRLSAMENARNELEMLRTQPYTNVVNFGPVAITNAIFTGLNGQKQRTVITNTDNGYKEVVITITWLNPGMPTLSVLSNNTIFFNPD
ncbi:MAG: hypothetical protein HYV36_05820 [Lentisphaerae bacterium]|nr:hypothetical protein [Lentisphaerota bacterium]